MQGLDVQLTGGLLLIGVVQQPCRDLGELAGDGGQVSIQVAGMLAEGQSPAHLLEATQSERRDVIATVLEAGDRCR